MAHSADHAEIAEQARRIYAEQLVKGLPAMVNSLAATARSAARQALRTRPLHAPPRAGARAEEGRRGLAQDHGQQPAQRAAPRRVGGASRRPAAARRAQRAAVAGRRRHHRARDPDLAPGAGGDGPGGLGVHRPARAHVAAGAARGARRRRTCCAPTCWRASSSMPGARPAAAWTAGASCSSACTRNWPAWSRRPTTRPTAGWSSSGVLPDVDLHPYIKRSRSVPTQPAGFSGGPAAAFRLWPELGLRRQPGARARAEFGLRLGQALVRAGATARGSGGRRLGVGPGRRQRRGSWRRRLDRRSVAAPTRPTGPARMPAPRATAVSPAAAASARRRA